MHSKHNSSRELEKLLFAKDGSEKNRCPQPPKEWHSLPRIGLNMIVKNEAHCIRKLLDCVAPHINCAVIQDNGSEDDTMEVIKQHMKKLKIPCEIVQSTWKNFGWNRSEALKACRGKMQYAWVIDADDWIEGDFKFPSNMTDHSYRVHYGGRGQYDDWYVRVFRMDLPWRYDCPLHEYPACDGVECSNGTLITGNYNFISGRTGARNKNPFKYRDDGIVLEEAFAKEPENHRYAYYTANSFFDAQMYERAKLWYKKRVDMGGWNDEQFFAQYKIAQCDRIFMYRSSPPMIDVHRSSPSTIDAHQSLKTIDNAEKEYAYIQSLLKAIALKPDRAEPYNDLSAYYRSKGDYESAYKISSVGMKLVYNPNFHFSMKHLYDYSLKDECSIASSYIGKYEESYKIYEELLSRNDIPDDYRTRINSNFNILKQKMALAGISLAPKVTENIKVHKKKTSTKKNLNEEIVKKEMARSNQSDQSDRTNQLNESDQREIEDVRRKIKERRQRAIEERKKDISSLPTMNSVKINLTDTEIISEIRQKIHNQRCKSAGQSPHNQSSEMTDIGQSPRYRSALKTDIELRSGYRPSKMADIKERNEVSHVNIPSTCEKESNVVPLQNIHLYVAILDEKMADIYIQNLAEWIRLAQKPDRIKISLIAPHNLITMYSTEGYLVRNKLQPYMDTLIFRNNLEMTTIQLMSKLSSMIETNKKQIAICLSSLIYPKCKEWDCLLDDQIYHQDKKDAFFLSNVHKINSQCNSDTIQLPIFTMGALEKLNKILYFNGYKYSHASMELYNNARDMNLLSDMKNSCPQLEFLINSSEVNNSEDESLYLSRKTLNVNERIRV